MCESGEGQMEREEADSLLNREPDAGPDLLTREIMT